MPSDQLVTPADLRRVLKGCRTRADVQRMLRQLETLEPDPAEYLMEELTSIHHLIMDAGIEHSIARTVTNRQNRLILSCLAAYRSALRRLLEP